MFAILKHEDGILDFASTSIWKSNQHRNAQSWQVL